jgi:hypothetical protein
MAINPFAEITRFLVSNGYRKVPDKTQEHPDYGYRKRYSRRWVYGERFPTLPVAAFLSVAALSVIAEESSQIQKPC